MAMSTAEGTAQQCRPHPIHRRGHGAAQLLPLGQGLPSPVAVTALGRRRSDSRACRCRPRGARHLLKAEGPDRERPPAVSPLLAPGAVRLDHGVDLRVRGTAGSPTGQTRRVRGSRHRPRCRRDRTAAQRRPSSQWRLAAHRGKRGLTHHQGRGRDQPDRRHDRGGRSRSRVRPDRDRTVGSSRSTAGVTGLGEGHGGNATAGRVARSPSTGRRAVVDALRTRRTGELNPDRPDRRRPHRPFSASSLSVVARDVGRCHPGGRSCSSVG